MGVTTSCSCRPAPQSRAPHFPVAAPARVPSKLSSTRQLALPRSLDLSFVKTCTEPACTHTHTRTCAVNLSTYQCTRVHAHTHACTNNAHRYLMHCSPACTRVHASHTNMQILTRACVSVCTQTYWQCLCECTHTCPPCTHLYTWMHEYTHVRITH